MFPNKFVVFWNDKPCRLVTSIVGRRVHFRKVEEPDQVSFFDLPEYAQDAIDRFGDLQPMMVREIQFRIVGDR